MKIWWCSFVVCLGLFDGGLRMHAQSGANYDALVHQGNAHLQAGSNDLALTTAQSAIKLNADRWEAYALVGGALMNLKRYEEAADDFSKAIERAPEAKQQGLRDLRKQCLIPESVPSPNSNAASAVTESQTTQAEIVLWKTIENSHDPANFGGYLRQYPKGAYVAVAHEHLDQMHEELRGACVQAYTRQQAHRLDKSLSVPNKQEFKAYNKAVQISDPASKAAALRSFAEAYPASILYVPVLNLAMSSDEGAGLHAQALDDANRILLRDPGNAWVLFIAATIEDEQAKAEKDPDKAANLRLDSTTMFYRCASSDQ